MFKKLNISLSESDIVKIQSISKNCKLPSHWETEIREELFNVLGSKIQFAIPPEIITSTEIAYPGAIPHTDAWNASISLYLEADNDETCFWEEIVATKSLKLEARAFKDMSNLKKTGFFIAQRGDCYLIDVNSIHSINMQVPNSTRKLLRLGWYNYSVDQIQSTFKIL